jgi:hypothetical protein
LKSFGIYSDTNFCGICNRGRDSHGWPFNCQVKNMISYPLCWMSLAVDISSSNRTGIFNYRVGVPNAHYL